MADEEQQPDTWEMIEDLIAAKAEKKFAAEMIDVRLASVRARELAGDIVRLICSSIGGGEVYVPRLARHHREERDTQIRMNFNGDCKAAAKEVPSPVYGKPHLSVRQVRRVVVLKK